MRTLVDSSIWVDYFKGGENSALLDDLIDENLVVINDLILSELIPFLKLKHQNTLVDLLKNVTHAEMMINWNEIIEFQYKCLRAGINGIGIPDLMIAQNAIQNRCGIYTLDSHFRLLGKVIEISLLTH